MSRLMLHGEWGWLLELGNDCIQHYHQLALERDLKTVVNILQRNANTTTSLSFLVTVLVGIAVFVALIKWWWKRGRSYQQPHLLRRRMNTLDMSVSVGQERERLRSNSNSNLSLPPDTAASSLQHRLRSISNSFWLPPKLEISHFLSQETANPTSSDEFRSMDHIDMKEVQCSLQEELMDQIMLENDLQQQQKTQKQRSPRLRLNSHNSASEFSVYHKTSTRTSSWRLFGPTVRNISFRTIVPPPSWAEASRTSLAISSKTESWTLSRKVSFHLFQQPVATLVIQQVPRNTNTTPYTDNPIFHPDDSTINQATHPTQRKHEQKQQMRELERLTFCRPVTACSLHIQRPVEGGVVEIYELQARERLLEHTFGSTAQAAQFQRDFLALQAIGPILHSMYHAMALLHQGSEAYLGNEPVLHSGAKERLESLSVDKGQDDQNQTQRYSFQPVIDKDSGIAWDDVMRCLGSSFPSIRLCLETIWWLHQHGSLIGFYQKSQGDSKAFLSSRTSGNNKSTTANADFDHFVTPEYADKRLLLGPVDFFRLFVPSVSELAMPEGESLRQRMEQLLRWRKRVARASLLVQAYVRARTVANKGWNFGSNLRISSNYLRRRLAFDDSAANKSRDMNGKNEYYEATLSRDVVIYVRSKGHYSHRPSFWSSHGKESSNAATTSLYQGYTLVGIHTFEWPGRLASGKQFNDLILHPAKDPVLCIPSLRTLIESNPELDFFVQAYFQEAQKAAFVKCFVRSLPKGVDLKFDIVVDRFVDGDAELRRRKLEIILQLSGGREMLSIFGQFLLCLLSLLRRMTAHRRVSSSCVSDYALNLSECGDTYHFGGSLQSDPTLPKNYVASTVHMESQRNNNFLTRMLLTYVEKGGITQNITDFTYVLAGNSDDELPERALCTARIVRCNLSRLPLTSISMDFEKQGVELQAIEPPLETERSATSLYIKIFVVDPLVVAAKSVVRSIDGIRSLNPITPVNVLRPRSRSADRKAEIDSSAIDPFEKAVNELVRILDGIKVPARHGDNTFGEQSILRVLSRNDIRRYFIASDCSLKTASVRLVESAVWRSITFPIDIRTCRIELQNGQFFQQGRDLDENPVFYFRNTCLGPWRKDDNAVIAAVLHRLENYFLTLSKVEPDVQGTLIVIMGRPYRAKNKAESNDKGATVGKAAKGKKDEEDASLEQATTASTAISTTQSGGDESSNDDDNDSNENEHDKLVSALTSNPRVYRDEVWSTHTSKSLIQRLIVTLLAHYPERLSKALVVIGHKNKKYVRSAVGGVLALTSVVGASKTRDKVKFLSRYNDLLDYVDRKELITLCGGTQPVRIENFECK